MGKVSAIPEQTSVWKSLILRIHWTQPKKVLCVTKRQLFCAFTKTLSIKVRCWELLKGSLNMSATNTKVPVVSYRKPSPSVSKAKLAPCVSWIRHMRVQWQPGMETSRWMWNKEVTKSTCQDELWCSFQCRCKQTNHRRRKKNKQCCLKMIFKTKLHPSVNPEIWSESSHVTVSYKICIIIHEHILSVTLTHMSVFPRLIIIIIKNPA